MAIAVKLKLEVHQLHFISAYLNGDIEKEIFMEIPNELYEILDKDKLRKFSENKDWLIKRALYGLKQSGWQWYKKLEEKLKQLELKPLNSDPCIYIYKEKKNIVLVAIYIDDLMMASNNPRRLRQLKTELSRFFEMRDFGLLNFFFGIEFKQDTKRAKSPWRNPSTSKWDFESFQRGKLQGSHNSTESKQKIVKCVWEDTTEDEKREIEKLPYQNLSSLIYLAVLRYDRTSPTL